MSKRKTIYNLKLHEELKISEKLTVQRVSSGWIYKYTKVLSDPRIQVSEYEFDYAVFVEYAGSDTFECNCSEG